MGLFENIGKRIGEGIKPIVYRDRERGYEVVRWRELSRAEWHALSKSFALLGGVSYMIFLLSPVAFTSLAGFWVAHGLSSAVTGKTFGEHYQHLKQRMKKSGGDTGAYENARKKFDMQYFDGAPIRFRDRGVTQENVSGPNVITLKVGQKGNHDWEVVVPRPEGWSSVPLLKRDKSVRTGNRRAA
jgi:hypothetical protein